MARSAWRPAKITIVPSAAARAAIWARVSPRDGKGAYDHGYILSGQCLYRGPDGAGQRGRTFHKNHQSVRSSPGAAARLGGFQGRAEPRDLPLHDLSRAWTDPGAS